MSMVGFVKAVQSLKPRACSDKVCGMDGRIRERLVSTMRAYAGVLYREPCPRPTAGCRPVYLDCSTAVALVCRDVLGHYDWLNVGNAGFAWAPSAYQYSVDLMDADQPEPGDLALYARPGPSFERWHVMMLTDVGGVIGACDVAGKVHEYDRLDYCERWSRRVIKTFPSERGGSLVATQCST